MTRMEFLKQLEYLLQDIDEKDREDALAYYMDYMDEAGLSETDIVDGLLDVPEKIAMSIRSSMNEERMNGRKQRTGGTADGRKRQRADHGPLNSRPIRSRKFLKIIISENIF